MHVPHGWLLSQLQILDSTTISHITLVNIQGRPHGKVQLAFGQPSNLYFFLLM